MLKSFKYMICLSALLLTLSFTSCDMETSDNGDLDGFWHLEQIDTLSTGGVCDYSGRKVFWGVQYKLISVRDMAVVSRGYYFRFNQTGDSLVLSSPYANHWHQDQGDDGGDIPIIAVTNDMRDYGVNQLEEHYYKEKLTGGKMVLRTKNLRLRFTKF